MSSNVFFSLSISLFLDICIYIYMYVDVTSYKKISPPGSSHFQALSCWFLLMVALCSRPREFPRLRRAITKWYSQRHSGMFDLVLHGKRLVTLRMFTVTSLMITIMNPIRRWDAQDLFFQHFLDTDIIESSSRNPGVGNQGYCTSSAGAKGKGEQSFSCYAARYIAVLYMLCLFSSCQQSVKSLYSPRRHFLNYYTSSFLNLSALEQAIRSNESPPPPLPPQKNSIKEAKRQARL